MQNCFEYFLIYILGQNVSKKSDNKNFEICKVFMCYILLNTYSLGQNVSKKSDNKKFKLYQVFMR